MFAYAGSDDWLILLCERSVLHTTADRWIGCTIFGHGLLPAHVQPLHWNLRTVTLNTHTTMHCRCPRSLVQWVTKHETEHATYELLFFFSFILLLIYLNQYKCLYYRDYSLYNQSALFTNKYKEFFQRKFYTNCWCLWCMSCEEPT